MERPTFDWEEAARVIARVADLSEAFAEAAGVGGMETAGSIVSYLAQHPRDVEPVLRLGVFELPNDWHERGRLTWHRADGRVVSGEYVRRARTIRNLNPKGKA